jgi:hypothetical protein
MIRPFLYSICLSMYFYQIIHFCLQIFNDNLMDSLLEKINSAINPNHFKKQKSKL